MNMLFEFPQVQAEISDAFGEPQTAGLRVLSKEETEMVSGGGRPPNIVWGGAPSTTVDGRGPIIVW